ncbi:MAG: hypothetical protein RLZZ628_2657 [Bacteroidota bacterium]|jgi:hypothetical protein
MSQIHPDIVEYAFSINATDRYSLNLLMGMDGVCYMVNDDSMNVLALRSYQFDTVEKASKQAFFHRQLRKIFQEDPYLRLPYRSVKVAMSASPATLIPTELYQEKDKAKYFQNIAPTNMYERFDADELAQLNLINVYPVDDTVVNIIQVYFPSIRIYHAYSALIEGYRRLTGVQSGHRVFINVRDSRVQLFVFHDDKLIFNNGFTFRTHKDLIYFVMLIFNQFELDPDEIPLMMTGAITEDSDICKYLYRYIRYIGFIPAPNYFKFGNQFREILSHTYFDLFSLNVLS